MRTKLSTGLPCALLLAVASACHAPREAAHDWQVLLDGTSLDSWRNYKSDAVGENWALVDGELVCMGGGADIMTRDQFADFIFEFEWKVSPKANSGIMYHVSEEHAASYMTGPEYQVLDNATLGQDGDLRTSASSNYALHTPAADFTKPVGEWNKGAIEVSGKRVRHWLNGELSVQFMQWTPEWEVLVKASKFDAMPAYGRETKGHIVLQDHGNRVYYRNIRIRSL